jgi:tetratricopeptide (TPR) repeat protein
MLMGISARSVVFGALVFGAVAAIAIPLRVASAQTEQPKELCFHDEGSSAQEKIDSCTKLIESGRLNEHDLGTAFASRGDAYLHWAGDLDHAIAGHDEAIRLSPNSSLAFKIRGIDHAAKKDDAETIADSTETIRPDPNDAQAYVDRGDGYFAKGDYDRAFADYDEAIRLNPKDAQAYVGRGAAYRAKGDYDRAIADYDEAIRLDPKDAPAYRGRGAVYFWQGDYDRAIADYDEAIRLDPKDARAYHFRGNAYFAKKNYDRAIADYDEAIRLDPKIVDAYSKRNLAYRNKAENSAPTEPATSFSAAMSVYGIGSPADANPKSHDPRDVCGDGREESIEACTKIINDTGLSAPLRAGALAHRTTEERFAKVGIL